MDYSPQGSSVNWILQAKILEWVAMPFSRDLPHPAIKPMLFMPPTFGRWVFTTTFCCLQSLQNQGLFLTVGSLNQFISVTQSCPTVWDPMDCNTLGFPVHYQFLKFAQAHVHQWCHPTISSSAVPFSSCPQSFPAWVFSNNSIICITWPKYWSFNFSISPSSEYSGLISFRINWLDLLSAQGTLKSLLQHHSSKASILWCSAFFMVQLWHPYITTGKIIALTR